VETAKPYSRLAAVYDEMVVDPCYERWATHLHRLWKPDPAGVHEVLDVGCGTGLLAAQLTSLGYHMTGVDASQAMLERARRLLGPGAKLYQRNLPDLGIGGVFDAAVATFDALNYLGAEEFRQTLAATAALLRPGGWLVFDLHTDAMRDFTMANPVVKGTSNGRNFTISSLVDASARTCVTRIVITGSGDGDNFAEEHRQYFHRAADVLDAVMAAGCALTDVTDEYSRQPADASTLRATWTARRT
jgi:SAM-dependent methyltransferase